MASLGSVSSFEIGDNTVYFKENIICTHSRLDHRNIACVKYLNLRHSSITDIEMRFLLLLQHFDIAFSGIKNINLLKNTYLKKVVADKS